MCLCKCSVPNCALVFSEGEMLLKGGQEADRAKKTLFDIIFFGFEKGMNINIPRKNRETTMECLRVTAAGCLLAACNKILGEESRLLDGWLNMHPEIKTKVEEVSQVLLNGG